MDADALVIDDEVQAANAAAADVGSVAEDLPEELPEQNDPAAEDAPAAEEAEGVVVSIGDEPAAEEEDTTRAPAWVRDLRKANREKDRRIRELEQKINASAPAQSAAVVVGEKPTLAGCEYDEDKFDAALEAWHTRKAQAAKQEREQQESEQKARDAWQTRLADYGSKAKALKVPDFEDAECVVQDTLSVVQQSVIVNGAKNPALLVYALGKYPGKARELAAIADPVKFAFAAAELELQLKTTPRKSAPVPEKVVRASAAGASSVGSTLDRLRAEAEKTGDYSKVMAFKRQAKRAA